MAFVLDSRLAANSQLVADLPLSALLLMKDATYPWVLLVPRRADIVEIIDLAPEDQATLWGEIIRISALVKSLTGCHKLNVGAIGNMVPQLHVHIVARNPGDPAWPAPIWGKGAPVPYTHDALDAMVQAIRARL